jgi:hypothetical protein
MSVNKMLLDHLQNHVVYPANKEKIVKECNRMDHVPKDDREWFLRNLPDRIYGNSDDVIGWLKEAVVEEEAADAVYKHPYTISLYSP